MNETMPTNMNRSMPMMQMNDSNPMMPLNTSVPMMPPMDELEMMRNLLFLYYEEKIKSCDFNFTIPHSDDCTECFHAFSDQPLDFCRVPFWEDGACSKCSDKLEIIRPLWDLTCGYTHGCDLYYSGGCLIHYYVTVIVQYLQNGYVHCPYTINVIDEVTKCLFDKQRQCSEFYVEASYDAMIRLTRDLLPQCKVPILPEIPQPECEYEDMLNECIPDYGNALLPNMTTLTQLCSDGALIAAEATFRTCIRHAHCDANINVQQLGILQLVCSPDTRDTCAPFYECVQRDFYVLKDPCYTRETVMQCLERTEHDHPGACDGFTYTVGMIYDLFCREYTPHCNIEHFYICSDESRYVVSHATHPMPATKTVCGGLNKTFECYDRHLTECSDGTYNTYLGLGNGTVANRAWSHIYEEYCKESVEPPPEPGCGVETLTQCSLSIAQRIKLFLEHYFNNTVQFGSEIEVCQSLRYEVSCFLETDPYCPSYYLFTSDEDGEKVNHMERYYEHYFQEQCVRMANISRNTPGVEHCRKCLKSFSEDMCRSVDYDDCQRCEVLWPIMAPIMDYQCGHLYECDINAAGSCINTYTSDVEYLFYEGEFDSCIEIMTRTRETAECLLHAVGECRSHFYLESSRTQIYDFEDYYCYSSRLDCGVEVMTGCALDVVHFVNNWLLAQNNLDGTFCSGFEAELECFLALNNDCDSNRLLGQRVEDAEPVNALRSYYHHFFEEQCINLTASVDVTVTDSCRVCFDSIIHQGCDHVAYKECSQCTFVWPVLSTMLDMVCRYHDGCNINAAGSCVILMADSLRHRTRGDDNISCRSVRQVSERTTECHSHVVGDCISPFYKEIAYSQVHYLEQEYCDVSPPDCGVELMTGCTQDIATYVSSSLRTLLDGSLTAATFCSGFSAQLECFLTLNSACDSSVILGRDENGTITNALHSYYQHYFSEECVNLTTSVTPPMEYFCRVCLDSFSRGCDELEYYACSSCEFIYPVWSSILDRMCRYEECDINAVGGCATAFDKDFEEDIQMRGPITCINTQGYERRIEQCYETLSGCSDVYRQVTHEHIERIQHRHCEVSPPDCGAEAMVGCSVSFAQRLSSAIVNLFDSNQNSTEFCRTFESSVECFLHLDDNCDSSYLLREERDGESRNALRQYYQHFFQEECIYYSSNIDSRWRQPCEDCLTGISGVDRCSRETEYACERCPLVWKAVSTVLDVTCGKVDECNINTAGSCLNYFERQIQTVIDHNGISFCVIYVSQDKVTVNECVRQALGGCISPFFEQRAEEQARHIEVSLCELVQPDCGIGELQYTCARNVRTEVSRSIDKFHDGRYTAVEFCESLESSLECLFLEPDDSCTSYSYLSEQAEDGGRRNVLARYYSNFIKEDCVGYVLDAPLDDCESCLNNFVADRCSYETHQTCSQCGILWKAFSHQINTCPGQDGCNFNEAGVCVETYSDSLERFSTNYGSVNCEFVRQERDRPVRCIQNSLGLCVNSDFYVNVAIERVYATARLYCEPPPPACHAGANVRHAGKCRQNYECGHGFLCDIHEDALEGVCCPPVGPSGPEPPPVTEECPVMMIKQCIVNGTMDQLRQLIDSAHDICSDDFKPSELDLNVIDTCLQNTKGCEYVHFSIQVEIDFVALCNYDPCRDLPNCLASYDMHNQCSVGDVLGCLRDLQNDCPYVHGYIQQFEQIEQFACNSLCDADLVTFAQCISVIGPLEYHSYEHTASCQNFEDANGCVVDLTSAGNCGQDVLVQYGITQEFQQALHSILNVGMCAANPECPGGYPPLEDVCDFCEGDFLVCSDAQKCCARVCEGPEPQCPTNCAFGQEIHRDEYGCAVQCECRPRPIHVRSCAGGLNGYFSRNHMCNAFVLCNMGQLQHGYCPAGEFLYTLDHAQGCYKPDDIVVVDCGNGTRCELACDLGIDEAILQVEGVEDNNVFRMEIFISTEFQQNFTLIGSEMNLELTAEMRAALQTSFTGIGQGRTDFLFNFFETATQQLGVEIFITTTITQ